MHVLIFAAPAAKQVRHRGLDAARAEHENGVGETVIAIDIQKLMWGSDPARTYTAEVSSDLITWTPAAMVTVTETATQVVLRENAPMQDVAARFFRLRASTP